MKPVAITAAGVLSPLGSSVPEFQDRLFSGESGITDERGRSLPENFPARYRGLPGLSREFSGGEHERSIFHVATEQLLGQILPEICSGPPLDFLISGHRDPAEIPFLKMLARDGSVDTARSLLVAETPLELASQFLRARAGFTVPEQNLIWIANGCVSGNAALGRALSLIRHGYARRILVMNMEFETSLFQMTGLSLLGALAQETVPASAVSRPFGQDRFGFVKSDGGTIFLVEALSEARARDAEILGLVSGYAGVADAYHLTAGRPDAAGLIRSMSEAIRDAELTASEIDCISAHATSTPLGDELEANAIRSVFNHAAQRIPVTALKSQIGHATYASGGLQALACLLMLKRQKVPPILNLPDSANSFDLDFVVAETRPVKLQNVLSNSAGFGGQNASLIMSRYPE